MTLLIIGLAIFFLVHFVPATSAKQTMINKIGQGGYMGVIALLSILSFIIIVRGYRAAPEIILWQPIEAAGMVSLVVMPLACVLLAAAYVPCNIKRHIRHPLLTAFVLWSGVHLLASGSAAAALIFASFGIYSIWRRVAMPYTIGEAVPLWRDVLVLIAGAATFATLYHYHEALSGIGLPILY